MNRTKTDCQILSMHESDEDGLVRGASVGERGKVVVRQRERMDLMSERKTDDGRERWRLVYGQVAQRSGRTGQ